MQSYSYFKNLAKKGLQGNFTKCMIAFLFVSLLPVLSSALQSKFPKSEIMLLISGIVITVILVPCFKIGAIEFLFKAISKTPASLGDIFNGFKYILKLIPVGIARLISFLPLIIASRVFINALPKEVMDILLEFSNNPENIELLNKITDAQLNTMLIMELVFIASIIISIYLNTHLSLCEYILCNERVSGIKSVIRSIKLMRGHILYYIGFSLSFILWYLFAAFTGGLSLIILYPYQQAAYIMLYMELLYREAKKNGEINNDEIKNDDNIKEDIV